VYGPFKSVKEAQKWAERDLTGFSWKVCQYIDIKKGAVTNLWSKKERFTIMTGICYTCQSEVGIRTSDIPMYEEIKDLEYFPGIENGIRTVEGETIDYLTNPHDFCGKTCDGTNTVPQAIIH